MSYAIKNLLFCTWRSPFFFPRRSEHNCDVACTSFPSHSTQRCNISTGALSRLFRSSHRAQRMTANPGIRIIICRDRRSRKFFQNGIFFGKQHKILCSYALLLKINKCRNVCFWRNFVASQNGFFFGQISSLPGTKYCVNISFYKAHLVVFVEERIVRHASVCEVELWRAGIPWQCWVSLLGKTDICRLQCNRL